MDDFYCNVVLATDYDKADQQRPTHKTAIMEGVSNNIIINEIIKFGVKDYVIGDGSKKRTVVCKVCSSIMTMKANS